MQVQFRPASDGGWFTFVSGTRVLAVASPVEDSFLIAGWAAIREPSGFQGLLDLLTSKGLGATPAFALIEWEAERATRIIVRGDTTLEVTNATGKHQLSAASVSTWVERSMPDVTRITLAVPNSSIASTAPLPLESGVALVAEFSIATQSPTPSMSSPAAPVAGGGAGPRPPPPPATTWPPSPPGALKQRCPTSPNLTSVPPG
jgi:hypothetical protein